MGKEHTTRISVFASHGLLLLHLVRQPGATMREMALAFSVSERRIARILRELREAGLIQVRKNGKRNLYAFNEEARLSHPTLPDLRLGDLLKAAAPDEYQDMQSPDRRPRGHLQAILLPFATNDAEILFQLLPTFL